MSFAPPLKPIAYNKLTKQFATVKEVANNAIKGIRTDGAGLWPKGEYIILSDEHREKFVEYQTINLTYNESWTRPSKDWIEWIFGEVPSSEGLSFGFKENKMAEKRQETLSEQKLRKEYEKMKKAANHIPGKEDRLEESQYGSPASPGMGKGRSVNSLVDDYAQRFGSVESQATAISSSEALDISMKRTMESGAPINNMGFYDEINWHMKRLGQPSVLPIAIKEAMTKLLFKKGAE